MREMTWKKVNSAKRRQDDDFSLSAMIRCEMSRRKMLKSVNISRNLRQVLRHSVRDRNKVASDPYLSSLVWCRSFVLPHQPHSTRSFTYHTRLRIKGRGWLRRRPHASQRIHHRGSVSSIWHPANECRSRSDSVDLLPPTTWTDLSIHRTLRFLP